MLSQFPYKRKYFYKIYVIFLNSKTVNNKKQPDESHTHQAVFNTVSTSSIKSEYYATHTPYTA